MFIKDTLQIFVAALDLLFLANIEEAIDCGPFLQLVASQHEYVRKHFLFDQKQHLHQSLEVLSGNAEPFVHAERVIKK
jgi:hypothetical protein